MIKQLAKQQQNIFYVRSIMFCLFFVGLLLSTKTIYSEDDSKNLKETIVVDDCSIEMLEHVILGSDRAGVLARIFVDEQDSVEKGMLVGHLRNNEAKALRDTSKKESENQISISLAQKAHEVAVAEHDQAINANSKGVEIVTPYELRRLKLTAEQSLLSKEEAVYEKELAALQLKQAQARLDAHDIKSPIKGIITRIYKHEGEVVEQGAPILEISNIETLKVEGFVNVIDVIHIKPGDPVTVQYMNQGFSKAVGNPVFQGKIKFVDVSIAQKISRKVRIWAEVENQKGLLWPGEQGQMKIEITKRKIK